MVIFVIYINHYTKHIIYDAEKYMTPSPTDTFYLTCSPEEVGRQLKSIQGCLFKYGSSLKCVQGMFWPLIDINGFFLEQKEICFVTYFYFYNNTPPNLYTFRLILC